MYAYDKMANMRCAFCFPIPSPLKSYTANLQHKKKTAQLLHASISDTEYKKDSCFPAITGKSESYML